MPCNILFCVFLGRNLALFKVADQSNTGWGGIASRAVDGNRSNRYNDDSCTHTARRSVELEWWRVDLGDTYDVNSVRITNRADKLGR